MKTTLKILAAALSLAALPALAEGYQEDGINSTAGWNGGTLRFRTSIYTMHFSHNPEHNNHQKLINLEYVRNDQWLIGAAYFRNSFNQPSEFIYGGRDFTFWQPNADWRLRGSLSLGILHGYKGKYKHKIPLNSSGFAPAIIPTLGLDYKSVFLETTLFGTAGIMSTVGFSYKLDN